MTPTTTPNTYDIKAISEVDGARILTHPSHEDDRGFFMEIYRETWPELPRFVQQNQSFSYRGVLRGMHFQTVNPQGKLVNCAFGTILDVIFDMRPESPTFRRGVAVPLAWDMSQSLYVPPGVAHGFLVLSQHALVNYNCTQIYDPSSDTGVSWESPEIKSLFPSHVVPTISARDRRHKTVEQFLADREVTNAE